MERSTELKLQDEGKLLCTETLASRQKNIDDAVVQLSRPCATLRSHLLTAPLDRLANPADRSSRVPFPLAPLAEPGSYEHYTHLKARLSANQINEYVQNIDSRCRTALAWYRAFVNDGDPGQYLEYSLADVKLVIPETTDHEELPEDLHLSEGDALFGPFTKARVAFGNFAIQNMWSDSMTPHTPVLLFFEDPQYQQHFVLTAYTLPGSMAATAKRRRDEGELGYLDKGKGKEKEEPARDIVLDLKDEKEEEAAENARDKGYAKDIYVRVSADVYRSNSSFREVWRSTSMTLDKLFRAKGLVVLIARLDTLFFSEYNLSLLPKLSPAKQDALLRPADFAAKVEKEHLSNAEFGTFKEAVQHCTREQLAPQQLRYAFNYVAFVVMRSLGSSDYSFLALGGPPGTGKTRTMCQAIIYSRQPVILEYVVQYLQSAQQISTATPVASIVALALKQRVVYMAPTNEAVDEGLATLREMLAALPLAISRHLKGVRVSKFDRAQRKPEHIRHHATYAAAELLLPEWKTEIERIASQQGVRRRLLQECWDQYQNKKITQEQLTQERVYIDEQHPKDEEKAKAMNQRKMKLENNLPWLQSVVDDPASFGSADLTGSRKRFTKSVSALLDQAVVDLVISDPKVVCFMTTGYPTPYNQAAVDALLRAIVVLDEASQVQASDLVRVLLDSIGLVACGDAKQLGAVIKGADEGTLDLRFNLMDKLADHTLWLTLCFRLPGVITTFLDAHRYNQTRLHSPTGQNILRWSPFHALELFQPVIVLDVAGTMRSAEGTSKYNAEEAGTIRNYLFHYHRAAAGARQEPIDVRVITPYSAQVEELKATCKLFSGCSSFKSFQIGTIETAQGSTTDLCIVSLVAARNSEGGLPNTTFIDEKKLTVAISRCRFNLVLVCDVRSLQEANTGANLLLASILTEPRFPHLASRPSDMRSAAIKRVNANLVQVDKPSQCTAPAAGLEWLAKGESSDGTKTKERIDARIAKLTACLAVL